MSLMSLVNIVTVVTVAISIIVTIDPTGTIVTPVTFNCHFFTKLSADGCMDSRIAGNDYIHCCQEGRPNIIAPYPTPPLSSISDPAVHVLNRSDFGAL